METTNYHFRKKPKNRKRWKPVLLAFVIVTLILGGLFWYDLHSNKSQAQEGAVKTSTLTYDKRGPKIKIEEPTFTLSLPGDWKEMNRLNTANLYSITWQATREKEDNRFMTIYVDKIPRKLAFNRLLPVEAFGDSLRHGAVSENCATYTEGGSLDAAQAVKAKETLAKWEDVSFMCDLPKVFDNVIGTSSKEGINLVGVMGEKAGKHNYFFTYTDHNIHPDYEIFLDIIKSFKAK